MIRLAAAWGLLLALAPWAALQARDWARRPDSGGHVPIVVLAAVAVGVIRTRRHDDRGPSGRWPGDLGLMLGLAMLALAWWLGEFAIGAWLGWVGGLLALAGWCWRRGGWGLAGAWLPSLAVLVLVVPPPFRADERLATGLQRVAATGGASLLDGLGIIHRRQGTTIELPDRQLFVEEACSGIRSLGVLVPALVLGAAWLGRGPGRMALLVGAGVVFDLLGNAIRVALCGIGPAWWGQDFSHGFAHDAIGFGVFAGAAGLVWLADIALGRSKAPVPIRPEGLLRLKSMRGWMAAYGMLGLLTISLPNVRTGWNADRPWWRSGRHEALRALEMPATLDGWHRRGGAAGSVVERDSRSRLGRHSRSWRFRKGDQTAIVSIDYPFRGWHDLAACYRALDWRIGVGSPCAGTPRVALPMRRGAVEQGALVFGLFDDAGRWLTPPESTAGLADLIGQRLAPDQTWYQVQVFITNTRQASVAEADALFVAAADAVASRLEKIEASP